MYLLQKKLEFVCIAEPFKTRRLYCLQAEVKSSVAELTALLSCTEVSGVRTPSPPAQKSPPMHS